MRLVRACALGARGVVVAGAVWAASAASAGQVDFDPAVSIGGLDGVRDVLAVDVDGDLDLDLVAAAQVAGNLSIHINQGNGTFGAPVSIGVASVYAVAAGDCDCDGDLDLVVTSLSSDSILTFRNNGSGSFTLNQTRVTGDAPVAIKLADIDNDSDLDAVVLSSQQVVNVHRNMGNATFDVGASYPVVIGWPMRDVQAADINGDGFIDISANAPTNGGADLFVLTNLGNGTFSAGAALNLADGECAAHAWGDMDGDGDVDLVLCHRYSGLTFVTAVWWNEGAGTFLSGQQLQGTFFNFIRLTDFNGDARLDIVGGQDAYFGVLLNNGNGDIQPGTFVNSSSVSPGGDVGDLDGDGDMDVVTSNRVTDQVFLHFQTGSAGGPGDTVNVPPIVVTALTHIETKARRGDNTRFFDTVEFDGVHGAFTTQPLSTAFREGMEVVVRVEAPPGQRFAIVPPVGVGATTDLGFSATWAQTLNGLVSAPSGTLGSASWENLIGPAPVAAGVNNGVSCNGRRMRIIRAFNVLAPCSFTAVEFRFPVSNAPPGQLQVWRLLSGYFETETEANPKTPDQVVMTLQPIPPACPADANGDNAVNGADLSVLLGQFGQSVAPGTGADLNGDGIVNGADLSVLLGQFGSAC